MLESPIKLISFNANKTNINIESALQSAIELRVDIVLIQEPWFYGPLEREEWIQLKSTSHKDFTQILPNYPLHLRPRTLTYVSKFFTPAVSLARDSPIDPDIQIIDITEGEASLQVINLYNQKCQDGQALRTFQRSLKGIHLHPNTILMGDFNSHHPQWNPEVEHPNKEAKELAEWFEDKDLELLNKPGEATFYRDNCTNISVIDLALISSNIYQRLQHFSQIKELFSDHWGFLLALHGRVKDLVINPLIQSHYNTNKANWDQFQKKLTNITQASPTLQMVDDPSDPMANSALLLQGDSQGLEHQLDLMTEALTLAIQQAAEDTIPRSKNSPQAKPW